MEGAPLTNHSPDRWGQEHEMYAGYKTAKVEFDVRAVVVDMVTIGGLVGDWKARSDDDQCWLEGLIGFERALSRAIDSANGVAEYKGITVTMSED